MAKFTYPTLRDSILLTLAYYQNFPVAKAYIPKDTPKENIKKGHPDVVSEIQAAIFEVDALDMTANKKFAPLVEKIKVISDGFQPNSIFFGTGSRLHNFLKLVSEIEQGGEYELEDFEDIFGLTFFHADEAAPLKFRNLYVLDALMKALIALKTESSQLLSDVSEFRAKFDEPTTLNISLENLKKKIESFIGEDTPEAESRLVKSFFNMKKDGQQHNASAAAAGADSDDVEPGRACAVM